MFAANCLRTMKQNSFVNGFNSWWKLNPEVSEHENSAGHLSCFEKSSSHIRRMVGALNSVAIGKLPPEEIKVMLQVPSKHMWPTNIQTGPPDGLYLCDVHYNPEDLIYDPEESQEGRKENDSDSNCE